MSEIDWKNLVFGYVPTDYNVRCSYSDGKWGELRVHSEATMNIHISAAVLHYAQECFEGLKAFRGKDGKVRIFRMRENAKRMQSSCEGIKMPKLPIETFEAAVLKAVELNAKFIPPYESGASLYIRPVLFGTTPLVGVRPAKDYEFIVFVTPVGPYFKGGFQTTPFMLSRKYDRAAPLGTGHIKVGGNYAASLLPGKMAKSHNFSDVIYLDPSTHTKIEEVGSANFFGITANNEFVTPLSPSILPSITKYSLLYLAEHRLGLTPIEGDVPINDLDRFVEAGACGTAAVISPIGGIQHGDDFHVFYSETEVGPVTRKLYDELTGIQFGDVEAPEGWIYKVD